MIPQPRSPPSKAIATPRFTHGKRSGVYGALRRFLSNGGSRSPLGAIVESENLEYKELTA